MKRSFLFFFILCSFSTLHAQFGGEAGFGLGKQSGLLVDATSISGDVQSAFAGVFAKIGTETIGLKIGANYRQQSMVTIGLIKINNQWINISESNSAHYAELPATVEITPNPNQAKPIQFGAGASYRFLLSGNKEIFAKNQAALHANVGFILPFEAFKLTPSLQVEYALKPLTNASFETPEAVYTTASGAKHTTYLFKMGVIF